MIAVLLTTAINLGKISKSVICLVISTSRLCMSCIKKSAAGTMSGFPYITIQTRSFSRRRTYHPKVDVCGECEKYRIALKGELDSPTKIALSCSRDAPTSSAASLRRKSQRYEEDQRGFRTSNRLFRPTKAVTDTTPALRTGFLCETVVHVQFKYLFVLSRQKYCHLYAVGRNKGEKRISRCAFLLS